MNQTLLFSSEVQTRRTSNLTTNLALLVNHSIKAQQSFSGNKVSVSLPVVVLHYFIITAETTTSFPLFSLRSFHLVLKFVDATRNGSNKRTVGNYESQDVTGNSWMVATCHSGSRRPVEVLFFPSSVYHATLRAQDECSRKPLICNGPLYHLNIGHSGKWAHLFLRQSAMLSQTQSYLG